MAFLADTARHSEENCDGEPQEEVHLELRGYRLCGTRAVIHKQVRWWAATAALGPRCAWHHLEAVPAVPEDVGVRTPLVADTAVRTGAYTAG